MNEQIKNTLKNLPDSSGCYIFRNAKGEVIYVGKAVSLKNRVRQYFHQSNHEKKVRKMVPNIESIEYILTDNEAEALMLENNLIKRYTPKYNILLKHGGKPPYICVTLADDYPQIIPTRNIEKKKGAKYFGPYLGMQKAIDLINTARMIYPVIQCKKNSNVISKGKSRPCLNYEMGKCSAPCAGKITIEEYKRDVIGPIMKYLSGDLSYSEEYLTNKMKTASKQLDFEKAAYYRDLLNTIRLTAARQKAAIPIKIDLDVIGIVEIDGAVAVAVFYIREGRMIGRDTSDWMNEAGEDLPTLLSGYLKQYYFSGQFIPEEILVPFKPVDMELIEDAIKQKTGHAVKIKIPSRGNKHELTELAVKNAEEYLTKSLRFMELKKAAANNSLTELKEILQLPRLPIRIECYDISNIQGVDSVASMVVAIEGKPAKKEYRRYKIKTVEGPDDFKSMNEVLTRRLKRAVDAEAESWALPDLIVIDGGAAQLASAHQAAVDLGVDVPMIGLAKKLEEIYLVGEKTPKLIPQNSPALRILTNLRDEAHRFAISFHRSLRNKNSLSSELLSIEGVGKKKSAGLFTHFGSLSAIKKASAEELAEAPGIDKTTAKAVYDYFRNK